MKTSFITKTEQIEYKINSGWVAREDSETIFEEIQDMEVAKQLFQEVINAHKDISGVVEISLMEQEDEEYPDIVDSYTIDLSPIKEYVLMRYYGQYMIGANKYSIGYNNLNLTDNQLLTRTENSSFQYHPIETFNIEDEVREFVKDFDKSSIIESLRCY